MPQNTQSGYDDGHDERETTTSSAEQPRNEQPRNDGRNRNETGLADWFTETLLRGGVAIVGIVLLIFALGQAVGADFLGMFAAALGSQVGRWLAVAVFALLIIAAAFRVRIRGRTHH